MCEGRRLLAEFVVGGHEIPDVPDVVAAALTTTADGTWVVWARKVAAEIEQGRFRPLIGGATYPADAVAECRRRGSHLAPRADCTCGFHAVSGSHPEFLPSGPVLLDVALSGRVLAFEWLGDHLLFRAERQTVVRVKRAASEPRGWPGEPGGRLVTRRRRQPRGAGPVRLSLPTGPPVAVAIDDDAGYCLLGGVGSVAAATISRHGSAYPVSDRP